MAIQPFEVFAEKPTSVTRGGLAMKIAQGDRLFDNQISQSQEWLTTKEAAAYLRITIGTLRNMTSNGQVPYYKLIGRNRYRIEDLRSLHSKNRTGGF
jgi:excisionase family DNA binding protein